MAATQVVYFSRQITCKLCRKPYSYLLRRYLTTRTKTKEKKRSKWQSVVGVEVHAQISSKSKLFSGAGTQFGALINNQVSFLDASLPGTLPVLNKRCVEASVMTALALSCRINKISKFDRKHYFYADLPAGYQITQQRIPVANDGLVSYEVKEKGQREPIKKSVRITQLQIEQDSGKSLHDEEEMQVLIDLNRAGVGLMEIVTEPDFTNGIEVVGFLKELQHILRAIGTCDGKMEEGSLRVDASVSIHEPGEPLGVRAEVKNLNSIRNVAKAVDKERLHDYRFMPEPNLPPLHLYESQDEVPPYEETGKVVILEKLRKSMPELPEETRTRLGEQYQVSKENIFVLMNEEGLLEFFEEVMMISGEKDRSVRLVVNWLNNFLLGDLNRLSMTLAECPVTPESFDGLVEMVQDGKITISIGRKVLSKMCVTSKMTADTARQIVEENDWYIIDEREKLAEICDQIIAENPKAAKKYKMGKTRIFKFFVGEMHKRTRDCAEPNLVNEILEEKLIS